MAFSTGDCGSPGSRTAFVQYARSPSCGMRMASGVKRGDRFVMRWATNRSPRATAFAAANGATTMRL